MGSFGSNNLFLMEFGFVPQRPKWRSNKRKDTAVKVYTVAQESNFILVFNVPCFASESDLINVIGPFGEIIFCKKVSDTYEHPEFTEVYNIKFLSIESAREMKRKCDELSLLGSILHVQYAPEFETIEETKKKFIDRREKIIELTTKYQKMKEKALKKPIVDAKQIKPNDTQTNNLSENTHVHTRQEKKDDNTESLVLSIREKLKRVSDFTFLIICTHIHIYVLQKVPPVKKGPPQKYQKIS